LIRRFDGPLDCADCAPGPSNRHNPPSLTKSAASHPALPALGFAIGPVFKQPPHFWEDIGSPEDFTNDNYIPVVVTVAQGIGEAGKTTAYVRRFNALIDTDPYDRNTPYIAISTRCAHLGCPVRWVDAAERFICPCHGGVYDLLGRRVGGPPVRPLDRFPTRVRNGRVELWSGRFSVNSELKRFSPRDPVREAGARTDDAVFTPARSSPPPLRCGGAFADERRVVAGEGGRRVRTLFQSFQRRVCENEGLDEHALTP